MGITYRYCFVVEISTMTLVRQCLVLSIASLPADRALSVLVRSEAAEQSRWYCGGGRLARTVQALGSDMRGQSFIWRSLTIIEA